MRVEKFVDQYEAVAETFGLDVEALRKSDSQATRPPLRWLAIQGGVVVGVVTARERPDRRIFLVFDGRDRDSYGALIDSVAAEIDRPLYAAASSSDGAEYEQLLRAGFRPEVTSEVFAVPFEPVLEWLSSVEVPAGFKIVSAEDVGFDELFELDNILRREVPGTDGWVGDISWLRSELAESPPFERRAYLVGVARDGHMVGLARVWRNADGPRFGMVATLPSYRRTLIGPALIRSVLTEARRWGHDTFHTETSIDNRHIHHRLMGLGAVSLGFQYQMAYSD